jgi:DNA-directed RNA polymerase subunit RPC12/RpoP
MRTVTYVCGHCNTKVVKSFKPEELIPFEVACEQCHLDAKRQFKNIDLSVEDENISAAKEIMKYSKLPSGSSKKVF